MPAGSLVVAFSRKAVLALARLLSEASGLHVGVLYGALPPQTRRREIDRFVTGELDLLCVTDVIGHGINLPARTVVLAETSKYDGQRRRPLHLWEVAQIIGRAGRFGLAEHGSAMVLRGVPGLDANASLVRQAVDASSGAAAVGPGITTAQIRPTLGDLGASTGVELWEAVNRWQLGSGAALAGHPWLRAAGLDPVAAALNALARDGLLTELGVAELWRLATLPVEDPEWVVEVARSVAEPYRRLRAATRSSEPTDWTLEEAERVAGRAQRVGVAGQRLPRGGRARPRRTAGHRGCRSGTDQLGAGPRGGDHGVRPLRPVRQTGAAMDGPLQPLLGLPATRPAPARVAAPAPRT